jgi:hypothetical protein
MIVEDFYPEGSYSDCFHDDGGFLTDDVTYWMPASDGEELPPVPSDEEKAKDLYHAEEALKGGW